MVERGEGAVRKDIQEQEREDRRIEQLRSLDEWWQLIRFERFLFSDLRLCQRLVTLCKLVEGLSSSPETA
jgi:hypothetical protein